MVLNFSAKVGRKKQERDKNSEKDRSWRIKRIAISSVDRSIAVFRLFPMSCMFKISPEYFLFLEKEINR